LSIIGLKQLIKALMAAFAKWAFQAQHTFDLSSSNFISIIANLKKDMRIEALILAINFRKLAAC
ncbi:MAG: hypothetical protein JXQ87_03510, partial [Bacteroidia bacterium]